MKILILDDDMERHGRFFSELFGNEVDHVYKVEDFNDCINVKDYDVVFLDHDLGGHAYVDSFGEELTGYDAAEALTRMPFDRRPKLVIIHSWNPAGVDNMFNLLKDEKFSKIFRIPFPCSEKGELKNSIERMLIY